MIRISILLLMLTMTVSLFAQSTAKEFKPSGKPIVQVFGTTSYNADKQIYEYSFGRAHLGYQYQFTEKWGAKIIIDRGRATSVGEISVTDSEGNPLTVYTATNEGSYYTMFLKFASMQWKTNDKLTLEGGAILQNHYITQERFWELRYVAQTFQDLYWSIPSSDLGFIAYYQLTPVVSFDAAITNGEGPRVKQDALGSVKWSAGLDVHPSEIIRTRFYYHHRQAGVDSLKREQLFSVFTGYKPTNRFRVGGEFNYMDNLNNADGVKSYGFSLYSAYQVMEKTELFFRYDHLVYDLNNKKRNSAIRGDGNTIIGGLSYSPVKNTHLSLNYQGWLPKESINQNENRILLSMEYKF